MDESGIVKFQVIDKGDREGRYGVGKDKPVYSIPEQELKKKLRPSSEPVSAVIEAMALVKPFEYILRHGEVKIDVGAQEQFEKELPIVRRVRLGRIHLIATYDPLVVYGGKARRVGLRILTDGGA